MTFFQFLRIRSLGILVVLGLLVTKSFAQNLSDLPKSSQKKYSRVETDIRSGSWKEAQQTLEALTSKHPEITLFRSQLAGVYYQTKQFEKAIEQFHSVSKQKGKLSDRQLYFLAYSEWESKHYADAALHFSQFVEHADTASSLYEKAIRYRDNALFAKEAVKDVSDIVVEALPSTINTVHPEYLPSITADGEKLIFTRRIHHQEDMYISEWDGENWSEGQAMEEFNTSFNDAAQAISADGKVIAYVTSDRDRSYGSLDIFVSTYRFGKWQKPTNAGKPLNSNFWESQPSLSAHGDMIFFSSNRDTGIGGKDIWYSSGVPPNKWSEPINLGSVINTPYNEESPFIHPDGETLYFMSNGHPGMGGSDLFMSRMDSAGVWGKPINLGIPINSAGDQGALFVDIKGDFAYYASDQNRENKIDIYKFPLPLKFKPTPVTYVKIRVMDARTKRPIDAHATLTSLAGRNISRALELYDGERIVCLPAGRTFALHIEQQGYAFHSEHFDVRDLESTQPQSLDVFLQRIDQAMIGVQRSSEPIVLRNIFFETGSSTLMESSTAELQKLKKLLLDHDDINVAIHGHTDSTGSEADNLRLSHDRAEAVYQFLVAEGIKAGRLTFEGFGEKRPVDDNETDEGRQNNRRTEFIIRYP